MKHKVDVPKAVPTRVRAYFNEAGQLELAVETGFLVVDVGSRPQCHLYRGDTLTFREAGL